MIKEIYKFLHPSYQKVYLDYKVDARPRYGHGLPPHDMLNDIISANRETYIDFLEEVLQYEESIGRLSESNSPVFSWKNGYLPGLDVIGLYLMLAHFRPRMYLEVGSGYSTIVSHLTMKDQGLDTKITSIDPQPRAEVDSLIDIVIRQSLETTDLTIFDQLSAGDILFIDNSHRILPNSDSNVFFLEVLPRLKKGVIVHIHDIYLPYDYPQFMCDRYYSEQYGLAIALITNPSKFEILLPNFYVSEDQELAKIIHPIWQQSNLKDAERHGGSFWLRVGE